MQGELLVQGSKNTALPVLAATLLGKGVFVLHHCPKISDVEHMLEMLEVAGLSVCMENGSAEMKKIADVICPSVTEDGIKKAFEKYHLM